MNKIRVVFRRAYTVSNQYVLESVRGHGFVLLNSGKKLEVGGHVNLDEIVSLPKSTFDVLVKEPKKP